jgi:hypothetical protein
MDGAEAGAAGELGIGLPDHRDIGECIRHFTVYAMCGCMRPPLLHVAQVIVSQMLATLEHLTPRDGGRTRRSHAPSI